MEKAAKHKMKSSVRARKTKTAGRQAKVAKYVGYLMELHKLQGMLLIELHKTVSFKR